MTSMFSRILGTLAVVCVPAIAVPSIASAHTDTDLVAVPAGEDATVTFRPQHGCGDSPTIAVSVRVPVPAAQGEDVDGWSVSTTQDDQGRTVVEWSGGSLPPDQAGAFPIEFVAPATVGELLTFPAVQTCANGEELPWISGDPAAEFPAPRLLVLPPGSAPAATVDDVAIDAPGRDQLTAIVDIDNPGSSTLPAAESTPAASTDPATTESPTTALPTTAVPTTDLASSAPVATDPGDTTFELGTTATNAGDEGSTSTVWIVVGVIAFIAIALAAILAARRRR